MNQKQTSIDYLDAKKQAIILEEEYRLDCQKLKEAFPCKKSSSGLTPDRIKFDPGYKKLKQKCTESLERMQNFNAAFVKQFKKEIRQERKDREKMGLNPYKTQTSKP